MIRAAALLFLVACGGSSFAPEDAKAIGDSERLCGYAFTHVDGGAVSADTRGCYCALRGVRARNHIADDAGPVVRCQ